MKDEYEMVDEINRFCEKLHKDYSHLKPLIGVACASNKLNVQRLYPNKSHEPKLFEKYFDSSTQSGFVFLLDKLKSYTLDEDLIVEEQNKVKEEGRNYDSPMSAKKGNSADKEMIKVKEKNEDYEKQGEVVKERAHAYIDSFHNGQGKGIVMIYAVKEDGVVDSFEFSNRISIFEEVTIYERLKFRLIANSMARRSSEEG